MHFPAEVEKDNALPSSFSSHTRNKCPFGSLFSITFFTFFFFAVYNDPPSIALKCSLVFLSDEGYHVLLK